MEKLNKFSSLKLKESVKKAIDAIKYTTMTNVQRETIPWMLQKRDVIVRSPTGTGKTLAFVVPLANMLQKDSAQAQGLIIAPTRELCIQISETIAAFDISVETYIGGSAVEEDLSRLVADVYVATPGRLLELMQLRPDAFAKICFLVLDEGDKLLDFGFESKLVKIIGLLPKARITGLFSATISEAVLRLSQQLLRNPQTISILADLPDKLQLEYMEVAPKEKIGRLLSLVTGRSAIIFFATCAQVDFFYSLISRFQSSKAEIDAQNKENADGPQSVLKIHGRMDQKERGQIYSQFREAGGILLSTDVAARGIDFKNVDLVVHFDIPKDCSNIVHRSGRTARNGTDGQSVVFVMPNEAAYVNLLKVKGIDIAKREAEESGIELATLKPLVDEELLGCAVKAFVSYIRSYKEHIVNYVLNYKELDYDGLAQLYFLRKPPAMPELKKIQFTCFEGLERKAGLKEKRKKARANEGKVKKIKKDK